MRSTLAIGSAKKTRASKKESDIIEPEPLGPQEVTEKTLKSFSILTGMATFGGPKGASGQASLRCILTSANAVVKREKLNAASAFLLIRNSMKGEAFTLMQHYSKSLRWSAFFAMVQSLSKQSKSNSALLREILGILQTRPTSSTLASNVLRLVNLHQELSVCMGSTDQSEASFENSALLNLRHYTLSWFPNHQGQVEHAFRLEESSVKNEASRMRANGDDDAADQKLKEFCRVSCYVQCMMNILSNFEPAAQINEVGPTAEKPEKADRKKVFALAHGERRQESDLCANFEDQLTLGDDAASVQARYGDLEAGQHMIHQGAVGHTHGGYGGNNGHAVQNCQDFRPRQTFQQAMAAQAHFAPRHEQRSLRQSSRHNSSGRGQNGSNSNPIQCARCGKHPKFFDDGRLRPCFRYPTLSPEEATAVCGTCGGQHWTSRCITFAPLKQSFPLSRPDRPQQQQYQQNIYSNAPRGQNNNNQGGRRDYGSQGRNGQGSSARDRLHRPVEQHAQDARQGYGGQDRRGQQGGPAFGGARPRYQQH